jgi:TPR repeat protein
MNTQKDKALEALERKEYKLAAELMLPLAESGDIEIQCALGTLYQLGWDNNRDLDKAVFWLKKSALAGSGLAAHNLGTLYMTCQPEWPLDSEESKKWRELANELGHKPFRF